MYKKWIGAAAVAAMLFSAVPAFAEGTYTAPDAPGAVMKQDKHAQQLKHLQDRAQKLGIVIDGKNIKTLMKDIRVTVQAKKTAQLQKRASNLGINTTGKTNQQLHEAIKQALQAKVMAKLQKKAAKLNISADGKTKEQLRAEISAAHKAHQNKRSSKTSHGASL
jgi:hypothetical protein